MRRFKELEPDTAVALQATLSIFMLSLKVFSPAWCLLRTYISYMSSQSTQGMFLKRQSGTSYFMTYTCKFSQWKVCHIFSGSLQKSAKVQREGTCIPLPDGRMPTSYWGKMVCEGMYLAVLMWLILENAAWKECPSVHKTSHIENTLVPSAKISKSLLIMVLSRSLGANGPPQV